MAGQHGGCGRRFGRLVRARDWRRLFLCDVGLEQIGRDRNSVEKGVVLQVLLPDEL
jgi:hypothetical protein